MQRNWMAMTFLGIVIVLFGAYALVQRNNTDAQKKTEAETAPLLSGMTATNGSESDGSIWSDLFEGGLEDDNDNMTRMVARATFEQMKALDQQGKSPFAEENANTAEAKAAVERSVSESANSLFVGVTVSSGEVRSVANNTKDAKRRYLKDLEAVLARYPAKEEYKNVSGGLQGLVEQSCGGQQIDIAKAIAENYDNIAKGVVTIQVPSQWVGFHKQMIVYYRQGNVIFDAIADCQTDPLRGFSAAQALSQFVSESTILQKSLQKMYTEVGL